MTTSMFIMVRDINGANSFLLTNSNTKFSTTLDSGIPQSCTAPDDFQLYRVIFSFNGAPVWVAINDIAVLPGNAMVSTNSELSPVGLEIPAGSTISFITSQVAAEIGVKFYAIQ